MAIEPLERRHEMSIDQWADMRQAAPRLLIELNEIQPRLQLLVRRFRHDRPL